MQKRKTFYVFGKKNKQGKTLVKLTMPTPENRYTEPNLTIKEMYADGSVKLILNMYVSYLKSLVNSPAESFTCSFSELNEKQKIGIAYRQSQMQVLRWAEDIIAETPF